MTVGVYGMGRFGRLWAELLSRNFRVLAANRSPVADPPEGVTMVEAEDLGECRALFLCVAISAVPSVLERISPHLRSGQLVADTCSVKLQPVAWMSEALPEGVQILGTHPMFGPDSLRNREGALPLVLSPVRVEGETYATWREHFHALGMDLYEMSPEEHDRQAAYTQGITHLIGRILADFGVPDSKIGTLGYRRLQQVMEQTCNDPYQLFLDLQHYNPYTPEMRSRFTESLSRVLTDLNDRGEY